LLHFLSAFRVRQNSVQLAKNCHDYQTFLYEVLFDLAKLHCRVALFFEITNQEMENALKQAESRGEKVPGFPAGKELLIPAAGFCAKTKNEETGMKVQVKCFE
jgi:hypothetical protein